MRRSLRRALVLGVPCGALSVPVFRDSTLFLLAKLARVMPDAAYASGPGPYGLPLLGWFLLLGAAGSFGIALLLRLVPLPDLLFGAVVGLAAAWLVPQHLPRGTPDWVPWFTGAAWGWGTAFLLRPLALRG
ncbi:hypothetical protein EAH89_07840 [Roseomonas nepalensis]|uniref:Uncharacterized protein n=1 Tax=Muricoccus nepalensis TaxID=1854500 RepID=A0A502GB09_9PROT|nr:hypothetical protein [Roseomonas nepalensis]TPG58510.1 hypothetical protein EAH89_07840 [Roseomonas nepalensis]